MVSLSDLQRLGEGREAEVFEWEPGTVLKLYRLPEHAEVARTESVALAAANRAGAPVPGSAHFIEVEGRPGIVMERLEGPELLTRFGEKPWTVLNSGYVMGRAHAELHAVHASDELLDLHEGFRQALRRSDKIPVELRDVSARVLDTLPVGRQLGHGDYHPGNVILTAEGPRVIDWPNAFSGDPDADVARTLLTLRLGEPGTDLPAPVRPIIALARRAFIWSYRRGYWSRRRYSETCVRAWMLPIAIHKLSDDVPEERGRLLGFIERLRKRSVTR